MKRKLQTFVKYVSDTEENWWGFGVLGKTKLRFRRIVSYSDVATDLLCGRRVTLLVSVDLSINLRSWTQSSLLSLIFCELWTCLHYSVQIDERAGYLDFCIVPTSTQGLLQLSFLGIMFISMFTHYLLKFWLLQEIRLYLIIWKSKSILGYKKKEDISQVKGSDKSQLPYADLAIH